MATNRSGQLCCKLSVLLSVYAGQSWNRVKQTDPVTRDPVPALMQGTRQSFAEDVNHVSDGRG